jgi:autotransporter-associated beta strand protein
MKQIPNTRRFNLLSWLHRVQLKGRVSRHSTDEAGFSSLFPSAGPTAFFTALACAAMLLPSTSRAALMSYEGFNYPTGSGNLAGQNGGFGWGDTWQTVVNGNSSVAAGSLVAGGNAPSGYDSHSVGNAAFTPNGTRTGRHLDTSAGGAFGQKGYLNGSGNIGASGKTIYISFLQQPNVSNNNYYEFEFHRGNLNDPGRIAGVGSDKAGSSSVYLRTPSINQNLIGPASTSVSFYVVRIDFNGGNDTVSVYQNPASAAEPATPTLFEAGAGDMSFNGISFGAFVNGVTVAHDEVRVGETWSDVVNPAVSSAGIWHGGGSDNNWSTGGNWDNNVVPVFASPLTFAGSTRLNNNNDLTGVSASSITFDTAAGAFVLNGNSLGLNGNISFNGNPSSLITQTINLPLTPSANVIVDTRTNGHITINGNITGANTELTKSGTGNVGILTLGGTNSLKGMVVNNGTNRITGTTAINGIGGSSFFYLADGQTTRTGTLIIENGANLSVSGGFQDAAVIGRDGGIGTIIQNGGTFSFNINDGSHEFLFVGASGNPNTRAEYDMNGGVLDMNGKTFGIALGANTIITGLLNQASGVITNVGQLYFSPFFSQGHGIYNLTGGSMYIGTGGIIAFSGAAYEMNLGGGTIGAVASWSSSLNMTLTGSNGPVTFNPGGNVITLSGVLSGSGSLTISGGGILDLSGANTYTGDTTVNSGSTLQLDVPVSSPGAFRLANNGALSLNYSGTSAVGSFYTNGVALPVGTYNSGNLPGFIAGSGNLKVTSGISTGLWKGLGGDNNWSTAGNWDNNAVPIFPHALTFAGSTRLSNFNDLTGITVSSFTFDSAAGPFVLNGNDITLSGGIGFNGNPASPVTQTINLNMTWNADKTIDFPTNGNFSFGGNISASANSLTKMDAGTLTFGGVDSFLGYVVNGGTNVITGNVSVTGTGGTAIYLGNANTNYNGTLVIQPGAALNVSGGFSDALVIGRDGGSGRLIQNGGTFSYYVPGHAFIFVGATSHAGTQAEYDMNGGLLNMGGGTLGVALGDSGVAYTATLNQTGGVISNIFSLDLGAVRAFGHGVYNLTGGTIVIDLGGITSDSGSYAVNLGGGTVSASSSWSSSLNMTLTGSNGPVTFNTAGNTITLSGILSGPGGLNVTGGGILEMSGANSYLGDTTVSSGILQLDSTGSSTAWFRIVDGALFNLNYSGNFAVAHLYTNGVSLPNGTYNSANLPSFISGSGNLQVVGAVSTGLWTGLGANNNWSTAGNWDNNSVPVFPHAVTFAGSTRLNNNNDLSGITVSTMTFSNTAGAFTIGGNDVTLTGGIGFSGTPPAPVTQTVNLGLTWIANQTLDLPANGNLTLGGNISAANYKLTQTSAANSGILTLGGNDALAGLVINGGTNRITGTTTVVGTGGGSQFYLANANSAFKSALIIENGANLSVSGAFGDALVIGRDGGVGTVIQNGGTFSFNINDGSHEFIFVGASGNPNTRAEYDMNGGVLDMNGKTFGIALGANTVITGLVNQTGGVITNVGQLYFSPFFTQGHGIYNLTGGSLYVGSGGIINFAGSTYEMYLGGGTVGATASWASTLNITLTGTNGPVTFDTAGNNITLSGALSGSGGLTKIGNGTLELAGADSYTGNTTVNAGTLKLDVAGTSASVIRIINGATLNLSYGGTLAVPAFYTNGVALPSGVYTSANLPGFITGTGSLTVSATAPPIINHPVVSGGNLIVTGSGGAVGAGYVLLTSTNVATPLGSWTTNTTGNFDGSGNFSNAIPVNVATPVRFFLLRTP